MNEMVTVLEEVAVAYYKAPLQEGEKISINRTGN